MLRRLRSIIRGVEESGCPASQLLGHAKVLYRSDRIETMAADLSDTLTGVIRAYAPTAEMKELTVTFSGCDAPVMVSGERLLIEAALRNLMDNTVKDSAPETEVNVSIGVQAGFAVVHFVGRGRGVSGVSMREQTRRLQRGRNVADVVGSALGLTIVSEVAAALGGQFGLADNPKGGTCATLSLPLC